MQNLPADRTSLVIAAEINMIKDQTEKIFLAGAIEIGRRLKEAKKLLEHGKWQRWLEDSVNYSERTAQNMIRLFETYGSQQQGLLETGSQTQALPANFSYTQALILLGIPEEERAQFITEIDLESMSTRELQKAVKERDQALREKTDLQQVLDKREGEMTRLANERDSQKTAAEEAKKAKKESDAKADKLSKEVTRLQQDANVKRVETMGRKLNETYYKNRANRIVYLLEDIRRNFREMVFEMKEFAEKEPEGHEIYRVKILEFLGKALLEKF